MVNGTFDQATTGWTAAAGSAASFTSLDGSGNSASGAISVTNTDTNASHAVNGWTTTGAFQCLPVMAGSTYTIAVQVDIPDSQDGGWAGFQIDYYTSAGCAGATATYPYLSQQISAAGSWQVLNAALPQIPLSVLSVAVRLVVAKPVAQASEEALFDNVLVRAN